MNKYLLLLIILLFCACTIQVKETVNEKKPSGIVEKDEYDEYEMLNMDKNQQKNLGQEKLKNLNNFLENTSLPDAITEKEKRDTMFLQVTRKKDLLGKIDLAENLRAKDYLKLAPKIKIEQRPVDTFDSYGMPIKKTENFYSFEVDLSKAFDLFDVSGNRAVEKKKARKKIKKLYFDIKRLVEKKAYYKDMIVRYEQQLNSKDIMEQKEARDKLPLIKLLVNDTDIIIAEKELEQEYTVLELEK